MRARTPSLLVFAPLLLSLGACAPSSPHIEGPVAAKPSPTGSARPAPTTAPSPPPPPTPLALDVDPTEFFDGPDKLRALCHGSLATAEAKLAEVRKLAAAPDSALTTESVLGAIDDARLATKNAGDFSALMAVAHPDAAARKVAEECEPLAGSFETSFYLDKVVADVVARFAGRVTKGEVKLSSPELQRMLTHLRRDYRRNGLELDAKAQTHLRELNGEITRLGQEFENNIAASTATLPATPKDLEGLPQSYLDAHKPGPDGTIKITTDYPDYFPVHHSTRRTARPRSSSTSSSQPRRRQERALLETLLVARDEKAKLLGYATWADYAIEPRMAKSPEDVPGSSTRVRTHIAKKPAKR
jgi:thimet oligopeptidase